MDLMISEGFSIQNNSMIPCNADGGHCRLGPELHFLAELCLRFQIEEEGTGSHFSLFVFESRTTKLHSAVLEVCAQDPRDNGLWGAVDRLLPTFGGEDDFPKLDLGCSPAN